jgi:hypothetical protein
LKQPLPADDEVGRGTFDSPPGQAAEATLEQSERTGDANAGVLRRVMDELDAERRHSRELPLNVLPARIVARLDAGETNIADRHDSVAVPMSDLPTSPPAPGADRERAGRRTQRALHRLDEACAARGC